MLSHQKQWQFLKKTAELGKIPHALLFYGQISIGKKALALELIKLLNCQNENPKNRPCQSCRSCQDISKNTHPDLFLVEPKENKEIQISQIRDLHNSLSLKSYSAPYKAAIINKAHYLNVEAQSAFLKMLEEPKGKTVFILITEYPEMLLPTILSRVERLRFYSSPAGTRQTAEQKKLINEILKVSKQDLASRFQYAKKMAEEPQDLKEVLDIWLAYFRESLLSAIKGKAENYSVVKLRKIIKTIQTIGFLLSTTNVNARLALEILMLEL